MLLSALRFLNQSVPTHWQDLSLTALLQWAVSHWSLASVPLTGEYDVTEATSAFSKMAR
ncbi:MAG: hypothetical protein ACMZI0_10925 [Symbiopectobacterium sp.]|uniref:hypothetical protein n=1 Tax=Symbiopectobacterium sp. TaxID=2952789 RepID=UPI0039E9E50A